MTEHDVRQHVEFSDQDHDHPVVMAEVTTSAGSGEPPGCRCTRSRVTSRPAAGRSWSMPC